MFYQCTVKDKDGKVKKVYSEKKLHKRYWRDFDSERTNFCKTTNVKVPVSQEYYLDDLDPNFYV